ncbi:MAG: hypothetical protein ACOX2L_03820 [Anaerolineae bacterium]|jgi:AraC-like DNA-binding protein|nr:hypothetical protein [Chloroflexota bacterium]
MDRVPVAITPYLRENELACADAHRVAEELHLSPGQLARAVSDQTSVRFNRCQLGLFGYGPKAEGLSKIVLPARHVPAEIRAEIEAAAVDGGIACAKVWEIAERHGYPRLGLGNIVEAMSLKVRPCQLGCF